MNEELNHGAVRRLLNEIAEMCDHATLTGSLSGGAARTAARYNSLLEKLLTDGTVPRDLFASLPSSAEFAEIGVEARMLASFIGGDKHKDRSGRGDSTDRNVLVRLAPFVNKEELGLLIREHARMGGDLDMNTVSTLAPFLGSDILGSLLREHLAKASRATAKPEEKATKVTESSDSEIPKQSVAPVYDLARATTGIHPTSGSSESIDDLLDLLKSPYLSEEERAQAVERLKAATGR